MSEENAENVERATPTPTAPPSKSGGGAGRISGVGLLTGSRSGLMVLDVDPRHGGDETLHERESEHGELPPTPRAETGSGGEHFYVAYTNGVRNTASNLGEGLDTRGEGGLVVAPPSARRRAPQKTCT